MVNVTLSLYQVDGVELSIQLAQTPATNDTFLLYYTITEGSNNSQAIEHQILENAREIETTSIQTFGTVSRANYYMYVRPENSEVEYESNDLICRADNGVIVVISEEGNVVDFLRNHTNWGDVSNSEIFVHENVTLNQNSCATLAQNDESVLNNPSSLYCNIIYYATEAGQWYIQDILLNPYQSNLFSVGFKAFTNTGENGQGDTWFPANSRLEKVYLAFTTRSLSIIE